MVRYPLQDFRVIDFSWVWAGPLLGEILADMGAEVIKVETNKRLDSARLTPGRSTEGPETDFIFHSINRNKLGVTIDMTTDKGFELIKELIKISDVALDNFSPKGLKKLGLDYELLSEINPKLVMVSLPAAGQYGPLSDIVTYAPSLGALCGYSSMVGYPGERVLGEQTPYLDVTSSIHGAFALLAALYSRERTGKGQRIDIAQIEVGASVIGEAFMEYFMNNRVLGTQGNRIRNMAPHNNYPCQGDSGWISIAIKTDEEWQSFCEATGNPQWADDERFKDVASRLEYQDELDQLVASWTKEHIDYEIMELLQKACVAAIPCLDLTERFSNPHLESRDVHLHVEHPATGMDIIAGIGFKFSDTPCEVLRPAPMLGQDNEYVIGKLLGKSKEEIAQLVEEKVLY